MGSLADLQFNIIFINGQKLWITAKEIVELLFYRYMIIFYLAAILVIVAVRPHDQSAPLSGSVFVLLYFAIYLVSFFNFAILLILAGWCARAMGRKGVFLTVTQFLTTFLNTWLASLAISAAGGEMISGRELLLQWLMNSVIFEMALTGFGLLLIPHILRDLRVAQQPAEQNAPGARAQPMGAVAPLPLHTPATPVAQVQSSAEAWIAELSVFATDVIRAEAQQNYVQIFTQGQRTLVRIPFRKFTSLMPEELGLRVHRSHWIARSSIRDFIVRDGKVYALLDDKVMIPVSRQYQATVLPGSSDQN